MLHFIIQFCNKITLFIGNTQFFCKSKYALTTIRYSVLHLYLSFNGKKKEKNCSFYYLRIYNFKQINSIFKYKTL